VGIITAEPVISPILITPTSRDCTSRLGWTWRRLKRHRSKRERNFNALLGVWGLNTNWKIATRLSSQTK
jgi:hypothetical protein